MLSKPIIGLARRKALPGLAVALALSLGGTGVAAAQQATEPAAGQAAAPAAPAPILDQAALDLLKAATTKIANAKAFEMSVRDLRDVPSDQGQTLIFVNEADVLVERPDKLRLEGSIGGADTTVVYDGKVLSIYDVDKNVVAKAEIAGTLDDMIRAAAEKHGVHFAFSDFIASDPYGALTAGLTHAYEGPPTKIDATETRHLIFAAPGIEWQLWIDPETSLPRMFAVTYLDRPGQPRFLVDFLSWSLDPEIEDGDFTLALPADATVIEFLPNDAQ